jgi:hypothetical protein
MTSETPSPTPPVLPLPNLPPLPPQLTPKSRRGRAHARAPPHNLRARYLSAQRSTRRTPSSRAACHFGREDARRASTRSVLLGQPIRPEEPARAPAPAYRRPSALQAALRAAQAVPPAHRRAVLTDVQLADADRDPIS